MPNWKQELYAEINAIEDVNANKAVFTIHIEGVQDFYAGTFETFDLRRDLVVSAPEPVSVRLIDGSNVLSGDFVCRVDYLQLVAAFDPHPDDPVITINGVVKTLSEIRLVTAAGDWGIALGDDYITIGGDRWQIINIKGLKYLNGEPAVLELSLRK